MTVESAAARRDEPVARLFSSAVGALDLLCVYIGDQLGLYRALAREGPMTSAELAAAAGVNERYAREWLEQQAVSAILDVENEQAGAGERRYGLPDGHVEVLVDASSLDQMSPMAQVLVAVSRPIDAVLDAFRTGGGVPFRAYGADMHEGLARGSGPMFERLIATEWFPAIPAIHERLRRQPAARVADLACGLRHSSIAIARGYPGVTVDGIDLDDASIARATQGLRGSGVEERVAFACRDAADPALSGRYDLVTIFEALHDMSHPVAALTAVRALLAEGGRVLVADSRTAERFSVDAGEHERLLYGFSVTHCLPVGMVGDGAAGTGTVMRPDTLVRYAREAGFSSCDVAPIDSDELRFYVLTP
jgi:2-polyprenyl-3-methyl-5-hydroxy-6-metoxy-1,4-benzoquinol methylase